MWFAQTWFLRDLLDWPAQIFVLLFKLCMWQQVLTDLTSLMLCDINCYSSTSHKLYELVSMTALQISPIFKLHTYIKLTRPRQCNLPVIACFFTLSKCHKCQWTKKQSFEVCYPFMKALINKCQRTTGFQGSIASQEKGAGLDQTNATIYHLRIFTMPLTHKSWSHLPLGNTLLIWNWMLNGQVVRLLTI